MRKRVIVDYFRIPSDLLSIISLTNFNEFLELAGDKGLQFRATYVLNVCHDPLNSCVVPACKDHFCGQCTCCRFLAGFRLEKTFWAKR